MNNETTARLQLAHTRHTAERSPLQAIHIKPIPAKKQWTVLSATLITIGALLIIVNPSVITAGVTMMAAGAAILITRFLHALFTVEIDISGLELTEEEIMRELDW